MCILLVILVIIAAVVTIIIVASVKSWNPKLPHIYNWEIYWQSEWKVAHVEAHFSYLR